MENEITSFYIADSELGFGAFALRDILKGEHICTFTGRPVTYEQSIEMGKDESYSLQISEKNYIHLDPPGKYINHSCEPNAGIMAGFELIALKDIPANQQICYDYSTTMLERHWEMTCKCGSRKCRHQVKDFDLLPSEIQTFYIQQGMVQPYIMELLKTIMPHQIKDIYNMAPVIDHKKER